MKRRILTYLQQIDELIQDPPEDTDWDRAIHNHLTQIQFFQHERLIHLIVTVLFALMTTSVVVGLVGTGSIWLTLLLIPLLILLFPYINHYYLLENGVQKMYAQYDRMLEYQSDKKWNRFFAVPPLKKKNKPVRHTYLETWIFRFPFFVSPEIPSQINLP